MNYNNSFRDSLLVSCISSIWTNPTGNLLLYMEFSGLGGQTINLILLFLFKKSRTLFRCLMVYSKAPTERYRYFR